MKFSPASKIASLNEVSPGIHFFTHTCLWFVGCFHVRFEFRLCLNFNCHSQDLCRCLAPNNFSVNWRQLISSNFSVIKPHKWSAFVEHAKSSEIHCYILGGLDKKPKLYTGTVCRRSMTDRWTSVVYEWYLRLKKASEQDSCPFPIC